VAFYRCANVKCNYNTANEPKKPCPHCGSIHFNAEEGWETDESGKKIRRNAWIHTVPDPWPAKRVERYFKRGLILLFVVLGLILAVKGCSSLWLEGCYRMSGQYKRGG